MINPMGLICLLPNKTGETYRHMLAGLTALLPDAAPKVILADFEIAAMNAFRACYPNANVTGCYFHLCQAVLRKVQDVGLRPIYDADEDVRGMIRCLPALAHVPVNDVMEGFNDIAAQMPQQQGSDEVLSYFEHTFIRGRRLPGRGDNYRPALFPPAVCNRWETGLEGI